MIATRSVTCPTCHGGARATVRQVTSAQSDAVQREFVIAYACQRRCEPDFDSVPLR